MLKLIRTLLVFLNVLVALVVILIKIGEHINPNTFVWFSYLSLVFLPIVLLNAGFVLFWMIFRKWYFLLSLVTLLIFSNTIKSVLPFNIRQPKVDSSYKEVKILSYNTMNTGMMKKHTASLPNLVINYILDSDADIVCLQELAFSQHEHQLTKKDFDKIFKKYPYQHIAFKINKWSMNMGIGTFSKYPIIKKENVDYHSNYNSSIFSDIVIGNDTIRIVNNHLESNKITMADIQETSSLKDNFTSEKFSDLTKGLSRKLKAAYEKRAEQANIVATLINESPYKVISCGDYNDVPSSYTYSTVKGDLNDAFKEVGKGVGWTFAHSLYRFRIDYIMYDKSFQAADYKQGDLRVSDHYPIQVAIYLPNNDKNTD